MFHDYWDAPVHSDYYFYFDLRTVLGLSTSGSTESALNPEVEEVEGTEVLLWQQILRELYWTANQLSHESHCAAKTTRSKQPSRRNVRSPVYTTGTKLRYLQYMYAQYCQFLYCALPNEATK